MPCSLVITQLLCQEPHVLTQMLGQGTGLKASDQAPRSQWPLGACELAEVSFELLILQEGRLKLRVRQ